MSLTINCNFWSSSGTLACCFFVVFSSIHLLNFYKNIDIYFFIIFLIFSPFLRFKPFFSDFFLEEEQPRKIAQRKSRRRTSSVLSYSAPINFRYAKDDSTQSDSIQSSRHNNVRHFPETERGATSQQVVSRTMKEQPSQINVRTISAHQAVIESSNKFKGVPVKRRASQCVTTQSSFPFFVSSLDAPGTEEMDEFPTSADPDSRSSGV